MATKVIMPQMGESIVEGTIIRWLKKVGERVERDEPLLEITTDKVDTEVPAPASGVLTEILVQENQTVQVHTVVAMIDGGAAASDTAPPAPEAKAAPAAATSTVPSAAPSQTAPSQASGKAGKFARRLWSSAWQRNTVLIFPRFPAPARVDASARKILRIIWLCEVVRRQKPLCLLRNLQPVRAWLLSR